MGSTSMANARDKVDEAIRQRLRSHGVSEEKVSKEILWRAIRELEKIAMDEAELNRVARELAVEPKEIEGLVKCSFCGSRNLELVEPEENYYVCQDCDETQTLV